MMKMIGRMRCWLGYHQVEKTIASPKKENIVAVKDGVTGRVVNHTMFAVYSWCGRDGCNWSREGIGRGTVS